MIWSISGKTTEKIKIVFVGIKLKNTDKWKTSSSIYFYHTKYPEPPTLQSWRERHNLPLTAVSPTLEPESNVVTSTVVVVVRYRREVVDFY